jgi:hypothetical protein
MLESMHASELSKPADIIQRHKAIMLLLQSRMLARSLQQHQPAALQHARSPLATVIHSLPVKRQLSSVIKTFTGPESSKQQHLVTPSTQQALCAGIDTAGL